MPMPRPMTRRDVLKHALAAAAVPAVGHLPARAADAMPVAHPRFDLRAISNAPIKIESIDLLKHESGVYVRATSTDGAVGIAPTSERADYFASLLVLRIAPFFKGRDARDLARLVDEVYVGESNYKLAGLPFWSCVAWCEFALLDLLGRMSNRSIGDMLGGIIRRQVPVYMSSMRRDTTPQQEVDWLKRRVDGTGARAIKLKIGGRMSRNRDAFPGRTDALIPLARKVFGDACTIYVDANGSYDAGHGIEVGKMLQDHNIAFFEEPCEWEDYAQTKRVADALQLPVAGGEQDSSLYRWREMIDTRTVDIVQPDLTYNGGFLRTIRVAEWAAERGMKITPHSPKADANEAYLLHFISRTPNAGEFHEYAAAARDPLFKVKNGLLDVPAGPGLGLGIDPAMLRDAKKLLHP